MGIVSGEKGLVIVSGTDLHRQFYVLGEKGLVKLSISPSHSLGREGVGDSLG